MSGRSRRGASLKRTVGTKSPKKRVVVVCEGEKTEPTYLALMHKQASDSLVELIIIDDAGTAPKSLVDAAKTELAKAEKVKRRTRDPNAGIDEIWCVFDVDQHPYIKEVREQAQANNIMLAISNPCIEVWFLLHFIEQTAFIDRKVALRELKAHIAGYDKYLTDLDVLAGRLTTAQDRAQKLTTKHKKDNTLFPHDNPSSDVWKLVKSLGVHY